MFSMHSTRLLPAAFCAVFIDLQYARATTGGRGWIMILLEIKAKIDNIVHAPALLALGQQAQIPARSRSSLSARNTFRRDW